MPKIFPILTAEDAVDGVPKGEVSVWFAGSDVDQKNDEKIAHVQADETKGGKSLERPVPLLEQKRGKEKSVCILY